jgi:catechol 2,3-dioxygenase-like lactoylglutathione lyase family enzyme
MSTRLFPMLSAEDFAASVRFYTALGGIEAYRFPEADPVFVTLRFGDSELGIGAMSGTPIHGRPQRPAGGHRIELCLYVDDVDAAAAAVAVVVTPPQDTPWGERIAYIEDPDGNLVMLATARQ